MNGYAVALTCCRAASILAINDLRMLALPCIGVRYKVVCPAWLAALPTGASNYGRLVMTSMLALGLAARQ